LTALSCDEFDAGESKIDTDYFGISSAKVLLKTACQSDQKQNELISFVNQYEFVIVTNQGNNPFNNQWLGEKTKAFLTDVNMKLEKKVVAVEKHADGVLISDEFPDNPQIIRLAETSFRFSRFLNDRVNKTYG